MKHFLVIAFSSILAITAAAANDAVTAHGPPATAIFTALDNVKIAPVSTDSDSIQYSLTSLNCGYRRWNSRARRVRFMRCQIVTSDGAAVTLADATAVSTLLSAFNAAGAKYKYLGSYGAMLEVTQFTGRLNLKDPNSSQVSFVSSY